jgi:tetratricopeptide (TPR) repeat protein
LYRSLLAERRVLVLLDNARDDEQVRPLLPAGPRCRAVVTSRTRLTGLVTTEGARLLTLGPLEGEQTREIFHRHLGPARMMAEPAAVEELSNWCAGLPLAAGVVAARAAACPDHSLAALARQLHDARIRLGVWETGDAATDLRTVFSWSCRQLSAPALRLFRLLGLGPGTDFAVATAASLAGLEPPAAATAVAELVRAHLVEEIAPGRFGCHGLLRAYAAELLERDESAAARQAATQRVLDHYLHTAHYATLGVSRYAQPIQPAAAQPGVVLADIESVDALVWFDTELPALLAAVERAEQAGFDVHAWQLSWCLMSFFDRRGRWQDLAETQRVALRAARRLDDRFARAWAHRALGYALGRLGDYEPAGTHLLAAVDAYEALGATQARARCHQGLAWILGLQGRHPDAMAQARLSLRLVPIDGGFTPRANALNTLGRCHAHLGQHDDALLACGQALAMYEQADNAYGVAEARYSLGLIHQLAGEYLQARAAYRHALELFRELGDRHYVGETLTGLADVSAALGEAASATQLWRRALEILTDTRHPDADRVRDQLHRAQLAS